MAMGKGGHEALLALTKETPIPLGKIYLTISFKTIWSITYLGSMQGLVILHRCANKFLPPTNEKMNSTLTLSQSSAPYNEGQCLHNSWTELNMWHLSHIVSFLSNIEQKESKNNYVKIISILLSWNSL